MRDNLAGVQSPVLKEILRHALESGGKRIRPQLTVLGYGLVDAGESKSPVQVLNLAIVFEYLHAASLLHDDIIDHATIRRGKPSANTIWGPGPVILAGDFLHARALSVAGSLCGATGVSLVGGATEAMVEAEFLQADIAMRRDLSVDQYFEVIKGKTGALIAAAGEAGVFLAGGNNAQRRAIRFYGEKIGLAFQVVDDLLDYQGDPEVTGKAVGNDWLEGKMTLPMILALMEADEVDRPWLLGLLSGSREVREEQLSEVGLKLEGLDGFLGARRVAQELIDQACSALSVFSPSREREVLVGLAEYVVNRKK
ncbi:MAG: polyprenyl synthetase family protein [Proteobacteria bacterium]|nr:polyprenyl synthetase family protein [Pseudomonadota bacterium]MBU1685914.1 polyprenyl synthetase family protein [Pseudomonadota bacterium]